MTRRTWGSTVLAVALVCLLALPVNSAIEVEDSSPVKPKRKQETIMDAAVGMMLNPDEGQQPANFTPAVFPRGFRQINARGNNVRHPRWGAANALLVRRTTVAYADGAGIPSGETRPGAREISNACAAQEYSMPNAMGASSMLWQWGQFVDHDITLVPLADPLVPFDIPVPEGDPFFDPGGTGEMAIPMERSFAETRRGVDEQLNEITAYIDGSNVYGSDSARARALRTLDGTGKLKTSRYNMLPFNMEGFPNAPDESAGYFLAGDFRANEQAALTALHTLFVREHNRWAERVARKRPAFSGDRIYEYARAIVVAELQAITYNEFLPVLLGEGALPPYNGYDREANAGIRNVFATAAYRVGHTMLPAELWLLDRNMQSADAAALPLADAFFRPGKVQTTGIAPFLRGLATQSAEAIDNKVVDGVRNFLFGPPGAGGFDLASLNIQRGRDHGLPGYNQVRADYGLPLVRHFEDIHADPAVTGALAEVYESVEDIDPWVGGLAEPHVPGAMVGPTFHAILTEQFQALRDGDRFWYERYLPEDWVAFINDQTLYKIIRRNTPIRDEIQPNVFLIP